MISEDEGEKACKEYLTTLRPPFPLAIYMKIISLSFSEIKKKQMKRTKQQKKITNVAIGERMKSTLTHTIGIGERGFRITGSNETRVHKVARIVRQAEE